jgi:Protein of unknown function (DUF4238)
MVSATAAASRITARLTALIVARRSGPPGGNAYAVASPAMAAKRHHTVSAFLLERFVRDTSSGRRVSMLEKRTGRPTSVSPRDATVRKHFYSLDTDDGTRDAAIESVLSLVEGIAAPHVSRVESGDFPIHMERLELALFIAICKLRTPVWREQTASVLEQFTASIVAERSRADPTGAKRALAESEIEMTPDEIDDLVERFISDLDSGRVGVEMPKNLMIKHFRSWSRPGGRPARTPDTGPRPVGATRFRVATDSAASATFSTTRRHR